MDSVDTGEGPRMVAEHLTAGDGAPRTTDEVADELGCDADTARSYLETLVELGLADSRPIGDVTVWWRTDEPDPAGFDGTALGHLDDLPVLLYRCRQREGWPMDDIRGDCERLTGYEAEAIESGAVGFGQELVHPADRDDVWDTIEAARDTDGPFMVQYRILTKGGETRWVWEHGRYVADDVLVGVIGLSVYFSDVTREKAREQRLERSERRYRTLVENYPRGAVALYDTDLRCTAVGGENLERLGLTESDLIGNYVGDVLPEPWATELVEHYERVLDGETQEFEVQDDDRIFEVYGVPVRDSDGDVFAVLGMSNDVTERREREAELVEQREQLDALNSINVVVREVTHTAFAQSTRDEVEAAACRELADADSYEFAWIAERAPRSGDIQTRTEAGAEDYVSELDLSADAMAGGPAARAFETGEVNTVQDVRSDPAFEPWRELAEAYGFRSGACIPISHENTTYGVLNVYADRPQAFEGREGDVIRELGEILGHAIAAVERKRALLSDELVELEFAIEGVFGRTVPGSPPAARITIDETVPAGDDEYLVYGTVEGGSIEAVEALVDEVPHWREASVIAEDDDTLRYEVRLAEPPVLTTVASLGGSVEQAEIVDGDYYMQIRMPLDADIRRVIETVQEAYPDAEVRSHRQVTRDDDSSQHFQTAWSESLTDRQRAALEAAFHAGYFGWPRDTSGEELADSLGVSPPTFYQHLRAAEAKLFGALLDDDAE